LYVTVSRGEVRKSYAEAEERERDERREFLTRVARHDHRPCKKILLFFYLITNPVTPLIGETATPARPPAEQPRVESRMMCGNDMSESCALEFREPTPFQVPRNAILSDG